MIEKQIYTPNKITPISGALAMHKNSQIISKVKPKIRIIHIFAPEIIKTDAANFRELVQRLTGKPTDSEIKKKSRKRLEPRFFPPSCTKVIHEPIKGEEAEIRRSGNSGGGFLGGFCDIHMDGFMQEINQFSFLEGTNQMDAYDQITMNYGGSQMA